MNLLTFLLVVTAVRPAAEKHAIPIRPDADLQARIDRIARAGIQPDIPDAERGATERELFRLIAGREKAELFIRQLLYYSLTAPKQDLRDAVIWITLYLNLAPETIAGAIVPYLETENDDLRLRVRILLETCVEKCSPSECHTFRHYSFALKRDRDNPPLGLVRYMFERDPSEALRQFTEVYRLPSVQAHTAAREELRWAEHIVNDAIKNANFLTAFRHTAEGPRDAVITLERLTREEATAQLDILSKSDDWWVRLYVAEILRQHPAFRTPKLVARLAADKHPLVREAIDLTKKKPVATFRPPAGKAPPPPANLEIRPEPDKDPPTRP